MVECRGLAPTKFTAGSSSFLIIESEGGTTFDDDVDVSEGDWADYDADHDLPVTMICLCPCRKSNFNGKPYKAMYS